MDTKTLTAGIYRYAETTAASIGADHGRAAASWTTDGNTNAQTYANLYFGIRNGDPAILDTLPSPDLSGQWADGYSSRDLETDLLGDVERGDMTPELADLLAAAADAYEMAFSDAVEETVSATCHHHLTEETDANYCRTHDLFGCWFAH